MGENIIETFGQMLERLRKRCDLTQQQLADMAKVGRKAIGHWEDGRKPQEANLSQLWLALESLPCVTPAEIMQLKRLVGLNVKDEPPNNLAPADTSLIGRSEAVEQVRNLIEVANGRVMTLVGTGGVGKSRLAQAVAESYVYDCEAHPYFLDGVYWVSLTTVTDPARIAARIFDALGLPYDARNGDMAVVHEFLRSRQVLLVLDGMESLIAKVSQVNKRKLTNKVITELLAPNPKLRLLVTSREALHRQTEKVYPVGPLPTLDPKRYWKPQDLLDNDSIKLFLERARDAGKEVVPDDTNTRALVTICRALDGLPLALIIAAAQTGVMTIGSILDTLGGRLDWEGNQASEPLDHQQTLRATIAWSYDLLNPFEQEVFRAFSVFNGGYDEQTTPAMCASVDALGGQNKPHNAVKTEKAVKELVIKSLVQQVNAVESIVAARFVMLDTIHQYAAEKLKEHGEEETVRRWHCLYFLKLVEQIETQIQGGDAKQWLDKLALENGNMRAALDWALNRGETELALRLSRGMARFWVMRGYWEEGIKLLTQALSLPWDFVAHKQYRVKALESKAGLYLSQQRHEEAYNSLAEQQQLMDETTGKADWAKLFNSLGAVRFMAGELEQAAEYFTRSLRIWEELKDAPRMASVYNNLAGIAHLRQDFNTARDLWVKSMVLLKETKQTYQLLDVLGNLGAAVDKLGHPEVALHYLHEQYNLARGQDNRRVEVKALHDIGAVLLDLDRLEEAQSHYIRSIRRSNQANHRRTLLECLEGLAFVTKAKGDMSRAVCLISAASALRERNQLPLQQHEVEEYKRRTAGLEDPKYDSARLECQVMTLKEAIEYGLAQHRPS